MKTFPKLVALCVLAVSGCAPTSLREAILRQEENGVIADGHYVVVPISDQVVLGYTPARPITEADQAARVLEPAVAPCFFVTPTEASGLSDVDVEYDSSQALKAELDATVAKLGLDLGSEQNATFKLTGLRVLRGVGVLNINGCQLNASGDYKVFTTLVKAQSVELTFDKKLKLKPGVAVPIPQAGGFVNVAASGEGSTGETTSLVGKNIILAGGLTDVHIDIATRAQILGSTPVETTFPLPDGFDGSVTVRGFTASEGLKVNLQTQTNQPGTPPVGVSACAIGSDVTLPMGNRCLFWLPPGNVQIAVSWSKEPGTDAIVLHMKAYRTNFIGGGA